MKQINNFDEALAAIQGATGFLHTGMSKLTDDQRYTLNHQLFGLEGIRNILDQHLKMAEQSKKKTACPCFEKPNPCYTKCNLGVKTHGH